MSMTLQAGDPPDCLIRCTQSMRYDYASDPQLISETFALLETSFPGISAQAQRVVLPGSRWQENSTPFLVKRDGLPIAHVGVLAIRAIIRGRPVRLAGIHAVCTHPNHRGRGHFRSLMEEALRWCDRSGFDAAMLFTGEPQLYMRFGFHPVMEHRFELETPPAAGGEGFREMDLTREDDRQLLTRLLNDRAPVSRLFGVVNELGIFSFHCPVKGLLYSPQLDAIVWASREGPEGTTLKLQDVIASRVPSLDAILARVTRGRVERVIFEFSPDQLGLADRAIALQIAPELMVRGPFAAESVPFIVPTPCRC